MGKLQRTITAFMLAIAVLLGSVLFYTQDVCASDNTVYLGDSKDLLSVHNVKNNKIGWNTSHCNHPIKIGTKTFDKGIGFHCRDDAETYVEFDISSLGMKYFSAYVGILQEADYFLEWGSIVFHVYGDGKLLAESPLVKWNEDPYFLSCSVEGVKKLRLVQFYMDGHSCDAGLWGDACLTISKSESKFDPDKTDKLQPSEFVQGDIAYLSDLYWKDSKNANNKVVNRDGNVANEAIVSTDGKVFNKGLGFGASSASYNSYIDINIGGLGYTKLASYYGISMTLLNSNITKAIVKFAVFGDDKLLWESRAVQYGDAMLPMECDITGVKVLRLAVAGASSTNGDCGTWGGAVISKSGNVTNQMLYTSYEIPKQTQDTNPTVEATTQPMAQATSVPTLDESAEAEDNTTADTTQQIDNKESNSLNTVTIVLCCCIALTLVVEVLLVITYKKEKAAYMKKKEEDTNDKTHA